MSQLRGESGPTSSFTSAARQITQEAAQPTVNTIAASISAKRRKGISVDDDRLAEGGSAHGAAESSDPEAPAGGCRRSCMSAAGSHYGGPEGVRYVLGQGVSLTPEFRLLSGMCPSGVERPGGAGTAPTLDPGSKARYWASLVISSPV